MNTESGFKKRLARLFVEPGKNENCDSTEALSPAEKINNLVSEYLAAQKQIDIINEKIAATQNEKEKHNLLESKYTFFLTRMRCELQIIRLCENAEFVDSIEALKPQEDEDDLVREKLKASILVFLNNGRTSMSRVDVDSILVDK